MSSPSSSPSTGPRRTLAQRRAADAWAKVSAIIEKKGHADDYMGEAHKLPVRIMASGLGQALAFLFAKKSKKEGLGDLMRDLSEWVLVERKKGSNIQVPEFEQKTAPQAALEKAGKGSSKPNLAEPDLLRAVVDGDAEFLRWATDETLAWLQWVNRFAEGLGRGQETSD